MSDSAAKRILRLLGSARAGTALLALIAGWVVLASFAPKLAPGALRWTLLLLLALSTARCAWQRSRSALRVSRQLRAADTGDVPIIAERAIHIECDPTLDDDRILDITAHALGELGLAPRTRNASIVAVSRPWSVWGSPVFHWALVALIVVVALGGLVRSSGQMGLAVGQTKPDRPESYGLLNAGPLKGWGAQRSVRVDAFDVDYAIGGVDRGPTPTVSVLGADGAVVASQRVYPNHILKTGALSIYPADYGLAADVSVLTTAGVELRRATVLLDFSGRAEGGTAPIAPLVLDAADGSRSIVVAVSVPLDRVESGYLGRLPERTTARVLVTSPEGEALLDESLVPGGRVTLPTGEQLRLNGVDYYARLQLVDDPTIPLLYAAVAAAMLGLGVATFGRQLLIVARVVDAPSGRRLDVRADVRRTAAVGRDEIEVALTRALGPTETGDGT